MATSLVSPGISISVIDESAYLPTAVGTVPFVLFASAENKTINGTVAPGTLKVNAGKMYGISSQRELVSTFGAPQFQRTAANTPVHGGERNEYGLMAAYSALALGNRVWAMRADIDLDQLTGSTVRPKGEVPDGTNWFDTMDSKWGIFEYDQAGDSFVNRIPLVIDLQADAEYDSGSSTWYPADSVGAIGDYAVVAFDANNNVFLKHSLNTWVKVGSVEWQQVTPTVLGSNATVAPAAGDSFTLNGNNIDVTAATDVASFITTVNAEIAAAMIDGVQAIEVFGQVAFVIDSTIANGELVLTDGQGTPLNSVGIANGTYYLPTVQYSGYASVPAWGAFDAIPRPTGSVWLKTSSHGQGANLVFKQYNAALMTWKNLATPLYSDGYTALYGLDTLGGGKNVQAGSVFVKTDAANDGTLSFKFYTLSRSGKLSVTGQASAGTAQFDAGSTFDVIVSTPGSSTGTTYSCVVNGVNSTAFVSAIIAANIPNITARIELTGAVTINHTAGGIITLVDTWSTGGGLGNSPVNPIEAAGFTTAVYGVLMDFVAAPYGALTLTNWFPTTYTYSDNEPYTAPDDGIVWYYSTPAEIDVMVCDTNGWKGYKNVNRDTRGFDLSLTDPQGVIISGSMPVTQTDNTPLVPGDIWLDSKDLENYPRLYRFNALRKWTLIDNTDTISQNGIVFADARWDITGTTDPISGAYPDIALMQYSDYLDLDAPDYRLFPRGTLLFNTRRSGYNVKRYVSDYFNASAYPNAMLPDVTDTWVTTSGLRNNGTPYAGHYAQRIMVVRALQGAIASSLDVREEGYNFTLLACPGYPELLDELVGLNNDRSQTGFVIGDTPMNLPATFTDITAFDAAQVTRDPYMALYYPSALASDLSGYEIAVPASHVALRTYLRSDSQSYQWFAPAGVRRGLVDNADAIGYINSNSGEFIKTGISHQLRDSLYELNINPITLLQGSGLVVYGQKTRNPAATALDRVNVARLVNYLRKILQPLANQFLFEPNDKITRDQIKQAVESALNDLIAKRGLYDYLVVCDTTNNTPDRIARNELYVDIAIEPMKDVEFIYVPIRLRNPGSIAKGQA